MSAPVAEPGKVCVVREIPPCDFCGDGTPGPYDFATRMGPWAHGCAEHWERYRVGPLGRGSGQLWVLEQDDARDLANDPRWHLDGEAPTRGER